MNLKIGAFSSAVKISKRMLRYYDEKGILCPQTDDSGYRVYPAELMERAGEIVQLRDMGFTIQEMKTYFEAGKTERIKLLEKKAVELTTEAEQNEEALHKLQMRLGQGLSQRVHNAYAVMRGLIPERCVVSITKREVSMDQLDVVFSELDNYVELHKCCVQGKAFGRFHKMSEKVTSAATVEVGIPVLCGDASDLVTEPASQVLEVLHYGSYDHLIHAYTALYTYADQMGLELAEPITEIYVTDSWVATDPADYVTIVQGKIRS